MTTTTLSPRDSLLTGARAMVPLALSVTPIGLTAGVTFGQLPVDQLAAWSTSWLIYSGSAQLVAVTTYAAHPAGLAAAVLAAVAVNARLALYGAAMAPRWKDLPLRRRLLAAYLLIDPSFANAQGRSFAHYLGGGLLLWVWWQLVTAVGMLAPSVVPDGDVLWAAAPLCFVAMLAGGALRDRTGVVVAGTAAVVGVAGGGLPWGIAPLLAMALAMTAGALVRRRPVAEEGVRS